jgi:hypothetical protein
MCVGKGPDTVQHGLPHARTLNSQYACPNSSCLIYLAYSHVAEGCHDLKHHF